MLPKPNQLPGNSTVVRRVKNVLMKEFERQGLRVSLRYREEADERIPGLAAK